MAMVDVTVDIIAPRFGASYARPGGGVVARGAGKFSHRFGGTSWRVQDPRKICGGPTLLFVFDLHDPVFSDLAIEGLTELPICSYTACDVWAYPQMYRIQPDNKCLALTDREEPASDVFFPELLGPFPEKEIHLEPMRAEDCPTSEESYWRVSDDFLGRSAKFCRVLGPPVWVFAAISVKCSCGGRTKYVCALGYEGESGRLGLIDNELLFLGESALYWFLCPQCLSLAVISQVA